MNRGCLGGLGRMVGSAFFRLGALLASVLISGLAFLALNVFAPLLLGALRELAQALMGMPRQGSQDEGHLVAANPAAYTVFSGLAWALGYALLAALSSLAGRPAISIFSLAGLSDSGHTGVWITMMVLFAVGAIVGLVVHQYQRGIRTE